MVSLGSATSVNNPGFRDRNQSTVHVKRISASFYDYAMVKVGLMPKDTLPELSNTCHPRSLSVDLNIEKKSLTNNEVCSEISHIRCCDDLIPATQLKATCKGGICVRFEHRTTAFIGKIECRA